MSIHYMYRFDTDNSNSFTESFASNKLENSVHFKHEIMINQSGPREVLFIIKWKFESTLHSKHEIIIGRFEVLTSNKVEL